MSSSKSRDQESADFSPSPTVPGTSPAPETPAAMLHHGSKHPASTSTSKSLTSHEPKSSVSGKKVDKRSVKKPEKDKKNRPSSGPTFPTFSYFFVKILIFLFFPLKILIFLLFPTFCKKKTREKKNCYVILFIFCMELSSLIQVFAESTVPPCTIITCL